MKRTHLLLTTLLALVPLTGHAAPSDLANMVKAEYDFADLFKQDPYYEQYADGMQKYLAGRWPS